jgi:hypothetical protein
MVREDAATKARRLLLAGAVVVLVVDPAASRVRARVEGDNGPHLVTFDPQAGWRCDCDCYRWACSHVQAVEYVRPANRRRHLASVPEQVAQ